MTPEQIDKMPAGWQMDYLVAKAMGWMQFRSQASGPVYGYAPGSDRETQLPPFSMSILAAWLVLDHLDGPACDGRAVVLRKTEDHGQWEVDIGLPDHAPESYRDTLGMGETAPLAICRAFLRWKTFDVPAPLPGERGGEEV